MGYFEFVYFAIYLILLTSHVYHLNNAGIEVALCIYCIYFAFFEAIQIKRGNLSIILNDFWKWIDYTSIILLFIYLVLQLGLYDRYGHINFLLAAVNFVSWMQGLSKLRIFRKTRIFIHLMKQVIYDITSFNIILLGSIFGFSTTYNMLVTDPTDASLKDGSKYSTYLFNFYYLFHGDFKLEVAGAWQSILFSLASFFLSLVMMNLVVALMTDTYNSVMTNITVEDSK